MGTVNNENVKEVVRYHPPNPEQVERHENLACSAETMIETLLKNCPDSDDRESAIEHVRIAKMLGSAAIALEGRLGKKE